MTIGSCLCRLVGSTPQPQPLLGITARHCRLVWQPYRPAIWRRAAQHYHARFNLNPDQQAPSTSSVAKDTTAALGLTLSRAQGDAGQRSGFPFDDSFLTSDGRVLSSAQVVSLMDGSITAERRKRLEQVVSGRTFSMLPVLEGLFDEGNVGAVCRTADALGYGAVHVINRSASAMKQSRGRHSAGAEKWLDVTVWTSTAACLQALKSWGFRVVVTALAATAVPITQVDWTQPTAVLLGNEAAGVSQEAIDLADQLVTIPMQGCMVDSFNVSVAAAIIMWEARSQRERLLSCGHADLTEQQRETLLALMMLRNKGRVKQGPLVAASAQEQGSLNQAKP